MGSSAKLVHDFQGAMYSMLLLMFVVILYYTFAPANNNNYMLRICTVRQHKIYDYEKDISTFSSDTILGLCPERLSKMG